MTKVSYIQRLIEETLREAGYQPPKAERDLAALLKPPRPHLDGPRDKRNNTLPRQSV